MHRDRNQRPTSLNICQGTRCNTPPRVIRITWSFLGQSEKLMHFPLSRSTPLVCNRKVLADILGVDQSTLRRWAAGGMPVERDRQGKTWQADSARCIGWLIEREAAASDSSAQVSTQRARLLKAQANRAEIELDETRGRLVDVDDVRDCWAEMVSAMRARVLLIPGMSAPLVRSTPPAEAEVIIRKFVHEALNELAGDGVPTAAKQRRERNRQSAAGGAHTASYHVVGSDQKGETSNQRQTTGER